MTTASSLVLRLGNRAARIVASSVETEGPMRRVIISDRIIVEGDMLDHEFEELIKAAEALMKAIVEEAANINKSDYEDNHSTNRRW